MKTPLLLILFVITLRFSESSAQTPSHSLVGVFTHFWNVNDWIMADSLGIAYDSLGRDTQEIHYSGDDPFLGIWLPNSRCITSYNLNGSIKEKLYMSYDTTANWDTTSRTTYSYNNAGQVALTFSENYLTGGGWQPFYQTTTSYDNNGNKIAEVNQSWNSTNMAWNSDNDQKRTYSYDVNNFLIAESLQLWNTANAGYSNVDNSIYTNDAGGHRRETLHQVWDGISAWYDMDKDSSIYDPNFKLIQCYHRNRHAGGMNQWGRTYLEEYAYHSSGKVLTVTTKIWDPASQSFSILNGSLLSSMYNLNNDITYQASYNWDSVANNWQITGESKFYYQANITAGIPLAKAGSVKAYPNPFHDKILVAGTSENFSVTIFDLLGREMTSMISCEHINTGVEISTEKLPPGIYLLKLISGTQQTIQKINKS